MDTGQGPVSASELLARIRQDRKARRGFLALSWVIVAGGLFELAVALAMPGRANPYLLPTLAVVGGTSIVTGLALLLLLRRSRFAPALMLLSCALFTAMLCLLARLFTFSP